MSKINSRQKGARGELELAHWLTERGIPARRGQQFSGGDDSPDVVTTGSAAFDNIHIECKRVEAGSPYVWMTQAIADAGAKMPTVFHRRNDREWLVVLRAEDFVFLATRSPAAGGGWVLAPMTLVGPHLSHRPV